MKKVIFIIFGIVALFLASVYLVYQPETDHFPLRTEINGIDVSDMSIQRAEEKLAESWNSKDFYFVYKGKFCHVPMASLTYEQALENVMSSLTRTEKFRYFFRIGNEFTVQMKPNDSEEFLAEITALPICDNTDKEKTVNAYVDLSDFEFRVVPEKIGTEVDPKNLRNIAYEKIADGIFRADLTDDVMIKQPEITVGSHELKDRLQYCKDNLSFKLEYDANGKTEVLTPKTIDDLVTYTDKGPKYNKKKLTKFIENLAGQVNEYQRAYNFRTHGGSKITVQAVTFGKVLDKDGTTKNLKKALKAQKPGAIDLQWAQTKYSGGEGIGNSYIEVSISQQHVWCYKNGDLVVDCDCVTGGPGHDTARGVFVVQYVTGPTTLRGENGDGTNYESPVNCFVPFYGGQGFHGSNGWRSQWGGNIYTYAGSHGCVNCPDAAAKKIADTVCYGYPVVIY